MGKFSIADPVIETVQGFLIVRDDLLEGGTKSRGLLPFVYGSPFTEFVYASPAYGYAQVALAYSARRAGKLATIFTAKRKTPHPLTMKAKSHGAKIIMVKNGYLNVVQKKAADYALRREAYLFPFGADIPEISQAITQAAGRLNITPPEVWTVSGSGTLTRVTRRISRSAPQSHQSLEQHPPIYQKAAHDQYHQQS